MKGNNSAIKYLYPFKKSLKQGIFSFLLLFVFHSLLNISAVYANRDSLLTFQPSRTVVSAANEEIVDLTLKLVNSRMETFTGFININMEESLDLITKNKLAISIKPGDSLFIPVKIFITKKTVSGSDHFIRFLLSDQNNNIITTTNTKLQVSVKRNVNMFTMVSNILLDVSVDSIKIPIRISNPGNTPQRVTIINRYPSIFEDNSFHATTQFTIQASSDTLITFSKAVTRKMFNSGGFDVTFSGLYANGDVFGMAYIKVQSAQSDRAFKDESLSDSYNENSLTLSSQNMFSANESYLLTGRGRLELPTGRLGYNMDLTSWKNTYSPPMMRSTWISYESHNMGVMAGNISRSMDINLNGRGATVFVNDTASNNLYEAGFIDGNYNLLGNRYNSFLPPGNAGWGSFTHTTENWSLASSAVYESNPLLNSRSVLVSNNLAVTKIKNLRFLANVSAGRTSEYLNGTSPKPSFAAGLGLNGTLKSVVINSSNYYSSGYYPGMRRGTLSLTERITWMREASNIWGSLDFNHYAPKAFSSYQLFSPVFSTLRIETGISGRIFNKLNISLAPVYIKETNNAYKFGGTAEEIHSMSAWNVNSSFNYPLKEGQYISVNTENGFYNSSFDPQTRFHHRSNLNYRRGIFNLSSTFQIGTFFMGEAVNNFDSKLGSQRILNIIPTIQKSFYRNKLRAEAGMAFMNSSFSGNTSYFTGRAEFDVMSKTNMFAAVNHNRFGNYNLSTLELGITQKLSLPKVGAKNGDLEVFIYKDGNQNGIYDQGDQEAKGHLLYINGAAFMTGTNSAVAYKNLPYETYKISVSNIGGWYAPDKNISISKKKERIEIALKRTGVLKGTLSYSFNEFSYEINRNLSGITVIATDENNIKHLTKTNSNGQFIFYLPIGRYSMNLDNSSLSPEVEIEKNLQPVQLDAEISRSINIKLIVKARKIETKKFISPNSPQKR